MQIRKSVMLVTALCVGQILGIGQAAAQNCPGTGTNRMSQAQITLLLSGNYACVGVFPNAQWNELHNAGSVIDYKLGPTDPRDPTQTVGTYVVSGTGVGVVTYIYASGGGTYAYNIYDNQTHPAYSFCTTGGGQNLLVNVVAPGAGASGHGGC